MADSLACSLEGRPFQTLLSKLSKKLFFGDESVSYDSLREELFQDKEDKEELESDEVLAQIRIFEKLLHRAAQKNWDIAKLESALSSSDINPINSKILLQFWNNEREKIHDALARACSFSNHLNDFSWRVDVKTASKSTPEINEPVAVLEFDLQSGFNKKQNDTVRFEMNRDEIAEMIDKLENVQKAVESSS